MSTAGSSSARCRSQRMGMRLRYTKSQHGTRAGERTRWTWALSTSSHRGGPTRRARCNTDAMCARSLSMPQGSGSEAAPNSSRPASQETQTTSTAQGGKRSSSRHSWRQTTRSADTETPSCKRSAAADTSRVQVTSFTAMEWAFQIRLRQRDRVLRRRRSEAATAAG